jgi:hypothetical protein
VLVRHYRAVQQSFVCLVNVADAIWSVIHVHPKWPRTSTGNFSTCFIHSMPQRLDIAAKSETTPQNDTMRGCVAMSRTSTHREDRYLIQPEMSKAVEEFYTKTIHERILHRIRHAPRVHHSLQIMGTATPTSVIQRTFIRQCDLCTSKHTTTIIIV